MGCIGSKPSMKKDNDLETLCSETEKATRQPSLRERLSQKKSPTLAKEPSLAKQPSLLEKEPSLRKESSQGELKSEKSKHETSAPSTPPTEATEAEVMREDVNIVINENFDWEAQDTRTKSEKNEELPKTPTPSPSPSLRKSPAFQRGQRRLSEGNSVFTFLI